MSLEEIKNFIFEKIPHCCLSKHTVRWNVWKLQLNRLILTSFACRRNIFDLSVAPRVAFCGKWPIYKKKRYKVFSSNVQNNPSQLSWTLSIDRSLIEWMERLNIAHLWGKTHSFQITQGGSSKNYLRYISILDQFSSVNLIVSSVHVDIIEL